jgi:hypothetical protein
MPVPYVEADYDSNSAIVTHGETLTAISYGRSKFNGELSAMNRLIATPIEGATKWLVRMRT